eukprot:1156295-Pelagomonas_calceolata.AAC.1
MSLLACRARKADLELQVQQQHAAASNDTWALHSLADTSTFTSFAVVYKWSTTTHADKSTHAHPMLQSTSGRAWAASCLHTPTAGG